jgi:hypothetical protein
LYHDYDGLSSSHSAETTKLYYAGLLATPKVPAAIRKAMLALAESGE